MDPVGYALISSNPETLVSPGAKESFANKICRVMEFNPEGDALIINQSGDALGTIDKIDIVRSFKCGFYGDLYITPPGMKFTEQVIYVTKVDQRKGGYAPILRQMVIMSSLHRGEFCDSVLWSKQ